MYRWPELQFGSWNPSEVAYRARETDSVVQLIEALNNDATRECALHLLSKVLEREGKYFFFGPCFVRLILYLGFSLIIKKLSLETVGLSIHVLIEL